MLNKVFLYLYVYTRGTGVYDVCFPQTPAPRALDFPHLLRDDENKIEFLLERLWSQTLFIQSEELVFLRISLHSWFVSSFQTIEEERISR